MSKVLNMVADHSGTFNLDLERKTAQAARRQGLVPTSFGRKGTPSARQLSPVPKARNWGPASFWSDPDADLNKWGKRAARYAAPRLLGLTPPALAKTLGSAAAEVLTQMATEWAEPPEPFWLSMAPELPSNFEMPTPLGDWYFNVPEGGTLCSYSPARAPGNDLSPGWTFFEYGKTGHNFLHNCATDLNYTWIGSGVDPIGKYQQVFVRVKNVEGGYDSYGYTWFGLRWSVVPEGEITSFGLVKPEGVTLGFPDPRGEDMRLRMVPQMALTPPGVPNPYPFPQPIPWNRLEKRSYPTSFPKFQGEPGYRSPTMPGLQIGTGGVRPVPPHVVAPPGYGDKERKRRVPWKFLEEFRRVQKLFHEVTEAQDAADAIAEAIPGEPCKGLPLHHKLKCIADHFEQVDIGQAIVNLVTNAAEDRVVGGAFKRLEEASRRLGIPGSYKFEQITLRR